MEILGSIYTSTGDVAIDGLFDLFDELKQMMTRLVFTTVTPVVEVKASPMVEAILNHEIILVHFEKVLEAEVYDNDDELVGKLNVTLSKFGYIVSIECGERKQARILEVNAFMNELPEYTIMESIYGGIENRDIMKIVGGQDETTRI